MATIGVCVFCAVTSIAALFNLEEILIMKLKKTIAIVLSLTILLVTLPLCTITVSAATDDIWQYYISGSSACVTGVTKKQSGTVIIPSVLGGYPVTAVGSDSRQFGNLAGCHVVFPQGVTSINGRCFEYCSPASITIPKSLTWVSFCAFNYCWDLTDVYYEGNSSDKSNIRIEYVGIGGNDALVDATWHYNFDYSTYEPYQKMKEEISKKEYILKHVSFTEWIESASINENYGFYNTIWDAELSSNQSYPFDNRLGAYKAWDIIGDIGKICSFSFKDIKITADYYELFLADLILAVNNVSLNKKVETKSFEAYKKGYSALKKIFQTLDEWDLDVYENSYLDFETVIKPYIFDDNFQMNDGTKIVLSGLLKDAFTKERENVINQVFEGFGASATICEYVTTAEDILGAFREVFRAYCVAKSYQSVSEDYFDILYLAAEKMENAQYSQWFKENLDDFYKIANSDIEVYNSCLTVLKEETYGIGYEILVKKFLTSISYDQFSYLIGVEPSTIGIAVFTYNSTYKILDWITNLSDEATPYYFMNYVAPLEKALWEVERDYANVLNANKTYDNAVKYDYAYKLLKQINLYLYQNAYDFSAAKKLPDDMRYITIYQHLWNTVNCHENTPMISNRKVVSISDNADITISDTNGNVLANIIDGEISVNNDSVTVMSYSGETSIVFDSSQTVNVKISTSQKGKISYSVSEFQNKNVSRSAEFYDLDVDEGQVFTGSITSGLNSDRYSLITNGTVVSSDYDSKLAIKCVTNGHMPGRLWFAEYKDCKYTIEKTYCTICNKEIKRCVSSTSEKDTLENGDIVTYGMYPQSKVTDSGLLTLLNSIDFEWTTIPKQISYGYYSDSGNYDATVRSEYIKYTDVAYENSKYRALYTNNTISWYKYEALKWRILDADKGLAICESIVDSQPFSNTTYYLNTSECYKDSNHKIYANNYAESSIRNWLNNDFFNTAFSDAQKSNLMTNELNNSGCSEFFEQYASKTTNDKVFLPSIDEVNNTNYGLLNEDSLYPNFTDYAVAQGLDTTYYYWRLRTSGYRSGYTSVVSCDGWIMSDYDAKRTDYGIRPLICFDFNNDLISSSGHWDDNICIENCIEQSCTQDGSYDYVEKCKICNAEIERETFLLQAFGHSVSEWNVITKPTVNDYGLRQQKCKICNETIAEERILLGDANNDLRLNANDLTYFRKKLLGNLEIQLWQTYVFDINGNDAIDIVDLVKLKKYLADVYYDGPPVFDFEEEI